MQEKRMLMYNTNPHKRKQSSEYVVLAVMECSMEPTHRKRSCLLSTSTSDDDTNNRNDLTTISSVSRSVESSNML